MTWRRLGDLYSDITAFGLHREAFNTTQTPFFLAEVRRKVFAKAYHRDQFVATLFDRPPRLLRRHSDCKWPLDLADSEILGNPFGSGDAQAKLTSDGWSSEGKFNPSTWARVRFLTGEMLEEILEYKCRPMTADSIQELKYVSNLLHLCPLHTTVTELPLLLIIN